MQIISLVNVIDSFHRGWVNIDLVGKPQVWLPYGTTFGFIENNSLMVLDGYYRGYLLDRKYLDNTASFGDEYLLTNESIRISYKIGSEVLVFPNNRYIILAQSEKIDLKEGLYNIGLPRFPHTKICKKDYLNEAIGGSRFAETWFEIIPLLGRGGSGFFIHSGEISEGCFTVSIKNNKPRIWNDIYFSLILNRLHHGVVADLLVYR